MTDYVVRSFQMKMYYYCVLGVISILSGCNTSRTSFELSESMGGNIESHTPDEQDTYAVFRGTGNTVCGFFSEIEMSNSDVYSRLCQNNNTKTFVLVVGDQIQPLEKWDSSNATKSAKTLLTDPISNKPFPTGTIFHFPGEEGFIKEGRRVLGGTIFSVDGKDGRFDELKGKHLSRVYCHSDGCTQAQYAALKGYITIDNLYHLGDPKGFLPQDINKTIHSVFFAPLDMVPAAGVIRFFQLWFESSYFRSEKGEVFQDSGAIPQINFEYQNGEKNGHLLTTYFNALNSWFIELQQLSNIIQQGLDLPKKIDNYKVSDMTDRDIRAAFSEYFNIDEYPGGYKGFNIQRGINRCTHQSDGNCQGQYYVNQRFAKHYFGKKWIFTGRVKNAFSSVKAVMECIDRIESFPVEKQMSHKIFKECQNR